MAVKNITLSNEVAEQRALEALDELYKDSTEKRIDQVKTTTEETDNIVREKFRKMGLEARSGRISDALSGNNTAGVTYPGESPTAIQANAEAADYSYLTEENKVFGNQGRVAYGGTVTTEKIGKTERSVNNITTKLKDGTTVQSHNVINPGAGSIGSKVKGADYSWDVLDANGSAVNFTPSKAAYERAPKFSIDPDVLTKEESSAIENFAGKQPKSPLFEKAGRRSAAPDKVTRFGKYGKMAAGAAALGGVLYMMMSGGGHQTNAQLYGQQPVNR